MEISVDLLVCEANGLCVGLAPEVFELDDDDELHIHQPDQSGEAVERVAQAVAACPKMALAISR